MAKKNKAHIPSCPWRRPPATLSRKGEKLSKQATACRGNGVGWPMGRDLRGGYKPSGLREVMSMSKPIIGEAYEVPKKKAG